MTLDEYVKIVKNAAQTIGTKAVVAYLISQVPFFGLPVIRQFTSAIVGWILGYALMKTEMGAFFVYIDLRVNKQGREFFEIATKHAQAKTPAEKAKYEIELKDAFRNLARLNA